MKYFFIALLSLLMSVNVNAKAAAKKPDWYGFLTVDQHPFESCKPTNILAISEVMSLENHRSREVAEAIREKEASIKKELQKYGWQGLLGYRVTQIGGGGTFKGSIDYNPVNGVIISTAIHFSGVAFKVNCNY